MQLGQKVGLKPAEQLRKYFGEALLEVATANPQVVVLDGDLSNSDGSITVRHAFPERFFNMGIAESNLISVAAGFASCGYAVFVTSIPSFLLCNAYDQIRLSVAVASLNVKLVGSHAGMSTGREGPSSMSIEDYALTGGLPTFTILVPSDPLLMKWAVKAAAKHPGPVYIRSSREAMPYIYSDTHPEFTIGRANQLREGQDVTLIACGLMVSIALDAAAILSEEGIQARVLDFHTLRPLDTEAILAAAQETGAIVTAEEHLIRGGMGSAIAQVVAGSQPVPMRFIGIQDAYPVSASLEELLGKYGMTAQDIASAAREAVRSKLHQADPQ